MAAEVAYARHMNLNALRVEGFWGSSEDLYDLCDENGILVMAGWSCQWEWEHYFGKPTDERYGGILSAGGDQARRPVLAGPGPLAEEPSEHLRLGGGERPHPEARARKRIYPDPEGGRSRPGRPSFPPRARTSELTGKSGVKMLGPYDWVPPVYWYVDTKNGGAYGFNTETGPGPQVPPIESLKKMIPEKDLWPINDIWYFHCCRGEFKHSRTL